MRSTEFSTTSPREGGLLPRRLLFVATGLALLAAASPEASAQARRAVTLPPGTVITVQTMAPLSSANVAVGQTFNTVVSDTLRADNYLLIPAGSRIRGSVTLVQPATGSRSGVIEVAFNRLMLPDGSTYPIRGKLTSTDSAERRQIESRPDPRVVLVGGRGGVGAAIAGAGSTQSSRSSLLSALGDLLSEGRDVSVPAGTSLAVQLTSSLALRTRGMASESGVYGYTIYTAADRIRAAQEVLSRENYYRGAINGTMNTTTQRAIFQYQADHNLPATGNLDWRTARAMGLISESSGVVSTPSYGPVLSASVATSIRRDAQNMAAMARQAVAMMNAPTSMARSYTAADMDLWFAMSAFADNASLYEQLVSSSDQVARVTAGQALLAAAKRVDAGLRSARPSSSITSSWDSIRSQLGALDPGYRGVY